MGIKSDRSRERRRRGCGKNKLGQKLGRGVLALGVALALGCGFAMPAAADYTYGVTVNGDRENYDAGPFKVIFLEAGDSLDTYEDGALVERSLLDGCLADDSLVSYYAVEPAIDFFAQTLGEKDATGAMPAAGSIKYYIGMQADELGIEAVGGFWGDVSDIYQKLVTPNSPQKNSVALMIFNSNSSAYVEDYPRVVSTANGNNPMRIVMHEFAHSLGLVDKSVQDSDGKYYWSSDLNAYTQGLKDIYGHAASPEQEIVLVSDGAEPCPDPTKFYLCYPGAANDKDPNFHGANVDALTNDKGISILGALYRTFDGVQEDFLDNGSSLSHVDSFLSFINYGKYCANTMVTELDLALLQDMGYQIDRGKYYGASYLEYGRVSNQGTVSDFSGDTYTQTDAFVGEAGRSFVTGAHIYRNDLTLNQNANITVKGDSGAGVVISGAGNTLNVAEGTTISANGAYSIGIGVNYGSNNNINIAGKVEAMDDVGTGIGLLVTGECVNFYSKDTYLSSNSSDLIVGQDVIDDWAEMAENNNGIKGTIEKAIADNNGYSVNTLNITGTLAGSLAAIYTGSYQTIKNINVYGDGKIIGDILFHSYPLWHYSISLADDDMAEADKRYMDSYLNFGMDADGNIDSDYQGSFTGNISCPWDEDPLYTDNTLIYLNHKGGTLDLNVNKRKDEAAIGVLSFKNEAGTITNLGGTLFLASLRDGYPQEQPDMVGVVEINGVLRPGGTNYADIKINCDEYKQGATGKLQLDFDFNTLEHDNIRFSGRSVNGEYYPTSVNLGKLELVEQNAYNGAPVMLTCEDFFDLGEKVSINVAGLEASVVTKEEAYGAGSGVMRLAAVGGSGSGTGYTLLRNSWGIYNFGSGFAANMSGDEVSEGVARALDQRASDFANATMDDRELFRSFMTSGDSSVWRAYANQLIDDSYARQLAAGMNINHLLSNEARRAALAGRNDDSKEWQWFAKPLAFTARQQGASGYSQSGNGMLLGADKQLGSTSFGFFGGYLHDSTGIRSKNALNTKRDGGFVGAYFNQAKDRQNGAFLYGFARYDNSNAKSKRQVALGSYRGTNEADARQQGGAVELGTGWNRTTGAGTLSYSAGVNYTLLQQAGFTENDGRGSAVGLDKGTYRSVLANAGVQYATTMAPLNKLTDYSVSVSAMWNQELHRSDRDYSVYFGNNPIPVHWENNEDKGWLDLSLQGQFVHKKNLAVTASLGTELFRKNHRGLSGSVKLEYGF